MSNFARLVSAFVLVFTFAGCSKIEQVADAAKQLEIVKSELEAAKTHIGLLESKVAASEEKIINLQLESILSNTNKFAVFTLGSSEFQPIELSTGALYFSIANVKPYANGTKITLKIGNPHYAEFSGLTATLDWKLIDSQGWAGSKQINIPERIKAGSWTQTSFTIEKAKAENIESIKLSGFDAPVVFLMGK